MQVLFLASAELVAAFTHPGVFLGSRQLAFIHERVAAGAEPFASAYKKAAASPLGSVDYAQLGPPASRVIDCGSYSRPDDGCSAEDADGAAAFLQMVLFSLTSDVRHAAVAVRIMRAYTSLEKYNNSNAPLQAAWGLSKWTRAAELAAHLPSTGWSAGDATAFAAMLARAAVPLVEHGAPENGNWELSMIEGLLGFAVLTENATLFDRAVGFWRARVPAYYYNFKLDGATPRPAPRGAPSWYGQVVFSAATSGVAQETCRDLGHTTYGVAATSNAAETALLQGVNLWAEEELRLATAFDFNARLMLPGVQSPKDLCGGAPVKVAEAPSFEVALSALSGRLGAGIPNVVLHVETSVRSNPNPVDAHMMVFETLTHGGVPHAPAPAAAAAAPAVPRLAMEAHGFNALDAWPQLLRKNVRWIKIDLALATRASCEAFSTFGKLPGRGNASECFSEGGAEYCCIALSGDTGSRPALLDPFNTTWDLIALLGDPASSAWLPALDARPLRLGLDAGGSPGGCLSGCAGAPLFRAFLLAWGALVEKGLNVLGSNDNGFVGWFQQLDDQCGGGGCSGDDAALAALPWVSQAGAAWRVPAGAAGGRFQVLNEDYDSFAKCCSGDCWEPSVAPSAKFPWLWYEQTGQADYVNFLKTWAGCAALPAARRANPQEQLLLVSNMAPETMQVFAAPAGVLAGGINVPAEGGGALGAPFLAATAATGGGAGGWAVLAARAGGGGVGVWALAAEAGGVPSGTLAVPPAAELPPSGGALVAFSWASVAGEDEAAAPPRVRLLLAAQERGTLTLLSFDTATGTLASVGNWSTALAPGGALLAGALVCGAPLPPLPLPPPAALPCAAALVTTGGGGAGAVATLAAPLGAAGATLASAPILVGSTALLDRSAALTLVWTASGGGGSVWDGVVVGAASANMSGWPAPGGPGSRSYLYGSMLSVTWGTVGAALAVSPPPPAGGAYPPRIGLGAAPRLTGTRFNGTAGALLLTTDGVCDAALYTNNADMWRCGLAKPSFDANLFYSAFQTVPGMLQYDAGTLRAWSALTASAGAEHLSICSRSIVHGKLEAAASGSGALLPWVVSREGSAPRAELAVLVAHEAARAEAPQWLLCGLPSAKEGLVWDSFDLVQFGALDE